MRAYRLENINDMSSPNTFRQEFLRFALECEVLRFGEFKTKSGRLSPYFFNSGLFNTGESLLRLGRYYADAAIASGVAFDMTFGPAYKGIPLVSALAIGLAEKGHNLPYSFNRKEAKDRGAGTLSAVQDVEAQFGIPVIAIASLPDVLSLVNATAALAEHKQKIEVYRETYGVVD